MSYQQEYQHSALEPDAFWPENANELAWFQAPRQALSEDSNKFARWTTPSTTDDPAILDDIKSLFRELKLGAYNTTP